MRVGIADSALKHGVSYSAVVEVCRSGEYLGIDSSNLMWWCGSGSDGEQYEVAGFETDDGAIILIHAMPMRWRKR